MLPIQKKISSYNFNSSNTVKYIVIHDVGAYGTAKNNVDYFYGGNKGASAHYFVDDISIWQSVEDFRGAWHCGDDNGYGRFAFGITNSNSIGIEMCLPSHDVTELTENNTIELVKYLMNKYNVPIERVVRHYDASRKNCPATFSANNWERWNKFKAKLGGTDIPSINTPVTSNPTIPTTDSQYNKAKAYNSTRCKELQEKLILLGYNCGGYGADSQFGKGTYDSLIQFQKDNGLVVDGLAGVATFAKLDELIDKKNFNSGDDWIRRLQQECNAQGFSNQSVDGIAGSKTLAGCPTLRQGARGNITKLLQEKLGVTADGIFGGNTKAKVIVFQDTHGLSADGIVGQNTWRKLLGL